MIIPTVGRIVWYYHPRPSGLEVRPLAAIVTHIHRNDLVNLCVFRDDGVVLPMCEVWLLNDDQMPPAGSYCCWMPYQKGQAAKTEQLEKDLADNTEHRQVPTSH